VLAFPIFKLYRRIFQKNEMREKLDPISTPQYILDEELEPWETRDEMASKIIQFGFIILFTAAFPFVSIISNPQKFITSLLIVQQHLGAKSGHVPPSYSKTSALLI
jgi:hypothetical protein